MKIAKHFKSGKRDSGETFVTMKDNAPQWLKNAVRYAHKGDLPNDWIYAQCSDACEAIDAGDLTTDDDSNHDYVDAAVDVYTRDLFQWAADMCLSTTYSDAEIEAGEIGALEKAHIEGLDRAIAAIQYCAIRYIAECMVNAANEAE